LTFLENKMAQNEEETIKSAVSEQGDEEMQESIVNAPGQEQEETQPEAPVDNQTYDYSQQAYPYSDQYTQQYEYAPTLSTDTITEISEQVVSEKLSQLKDDLEKILDLKTVLDSKIDFIDQRLKRIESIIDKLQLSVLQRVGEYVENVQNLKNEIIETQKSFKSLLDSSQKSK
jgi:hypothetical protein